MIVVIGAVRLRETDGRTEAVGLAASIAAAAASAGSKVELVGRVGDDSSGDALILALARAGIGHVAVIRDPAHRTPVVADGGEDPGSDDDTGAPADFSLSMPIDLEGADAELALRYLPDIRAIVTVHVPAEVNAQAVAAASWASAPLIVVVPPSGEPSVGDLPDTATSIALEDDGGSLGGASIGRFAAALDQGSDAREAWASLLAAVRAAG